MVTSRFFHFSHFFKNPKVSGRFKNGHKKYVQFSFGQKSLGKMKNWKNLFKLGKIIYLLKVFKEIFFLQIY